MTVPILSSLMLSFVTQLIQTCKLHERKVTEVILPYVWYQSLTKSLTRVWVGSNLKDNASEPFMLFGVRIIQGDETLIVKLEEFKKWNETQTEEIK